MSIYQGETLLASSASYYPNLFDVKWSDHLLDDVSWLRADTFSWQDGTVYTTAYNKLVEEYATGEEETYASDELVFRRSSNGFKIITANYEDKLLARYNNQTTNNGPWDSWFYILDTENKRFKLPRTKKGFEGLRDTVGNVIEESLPNITGGSWNSEYVWPTATGGGAVVLDGNGFSNPDRSVASSGTTTSYAWWSFDASKSNSTYQDNAPVQERATQMYLYFYVGEYSQTAIEQTAGITTEQLNSKLDLSGGTMTGILKTPSIELGNSSSALGHIEMYGGGQSYGGFIDFHYGSDTSDFTSRIIENTKGLISINDSNGVYLKVCYVNGTSGYNIWTNGYCEQWGISTYPQLSANTGGSNTITFLKTFANTNYNFLVSMRTDGGTTLYLRNNQSDPSTNQIIVYWFSASIATNGSGLYYWKASGYLAEGQY